MRAVRSFDPVTILSAENAAALTSARCFAHVRRSAPLSASQSRSVRSSEPVKITAPSPE